METGFFAPGVLQAYKVTVGTSTQEYFHKPITVCRYNPEEDTGVGNKVWLTSVMVDKNGNHQVTMILSWHKSHYT